MITIVNSVVQVGNGTTAPIDTLGASGIFAFVVDTGSPITPPSDNFSNGYTELTPRNFSSGAASLWYVAFANTGPAQQFTLSGITPTGIFVAFTEVDFFSPFDQENGTSNSSPPASPTGAVSPSQDNCLVLTALGGFADAGAIMSTPGFSMIEEVPFNFDTFGSFSAALAYSVQTAAASTNSAWAWSGTGIVTNAAVIADFIPLGAPPSTAQPGNLTRLGVG